MERKGRSGIVRGAILILAGIILLVWQIVPGVRVWFGAEESWPLIIVGVGVLLLVIGLLTGESGMAVPACIVGGIGGILWYQNATGHWESWAYVWALIPGFVGVGVILAGILEGRLAEPLKSGGWLILISLIIFVVFGSAFGGLGILGSYWPALLIVLGVLLLLRAVLRSGRKPGTT